MSKLASILGRGAALIGGIFFVSTGPALAGVTINVPEPMTMSLLAAGAVGLYAVKKFRNRR